MKTSTLLDVNQLSINSIREGLLVKLWVDIYPNLLVRVFEG